MLDGEEPVKYKGRGVLDSGQLPDSSSRLIDAYTGGPPGANRFMDSGVLGACQGVCRSCV